MTSTPSAVRSELVIRRGRTADIEAVLSLAEASSAAAQWSRDEYVTVCAPLDRDQGHAKALFVACTPGAPQPLSTAFHGFAAFSAVPLAGEYELANMAVAADIQRQGVGSRLLAAGIFWCRSWGPAAPSVNSPQTRQNATDDPILRLEVRASNRIAIAFYRRAGFAVTGVRSRYYARPAEDAILMRRPLRERP